VKELKEPKWDKPSNVSEIGSDIHIWRADLNIFECNTKILSYDELKRIEQYSDDSLKIKFCISRSILRLILTKYLDLSQENIHINNLDNGRPVLANSEINLDFNLSHMENWLLVAISRNRKIGIDIEKCNSQFNRKKISSRFFEKDVYIKLKDCNFDEKFFCKLWTQFEARQKCFGFGVFGEKVKSNKVKTKSFEIFEGVYSSIVWSDTLNNPSIFYYDL
tara:strand:- start:9492 stop:10151 length:660 start_codon:yes stop_codon:yes gene_type:complete